MPSTIATLTINKYYKIRLRQRDILGEELNKHFTVYNAGAAGNVQAALRAYEALSQAGIMKASASLDAEYTDASALITDPPLGLFPKIGDVLVLVFTKVHPLDASKVDTREFAILAPVPGIYDEATRKPVMTRGVAFGAAANVAETLGALVDYLCNALVVEVFGTQYPGGYTYSESESRLIGIPKTYDGNPIS